MNFKSILKRRKLWAIAIYRLQDERDIFSLSDHEPFYFIGEKGIRKNTDYQHIAADPFVFVHNDRLYLFYEIQTDFGVGEIWAKSMDQQGVWVSHGQVLKEDFHLSYPQVFSYDGQVYMIPETSDSGKVWLYATASFPYKWQKNRMLIDEALLDPSIVINNDGIFLFGTSRKNELKLYFFENFNHEVVPLGAVMPSEDFLARNAGRPIYIRNELYRVAQISKSSYGQGGVSLLKVDELSIENYSEHIVIPELYKIRPKWMKSGYHHLSCAMFFNEHFVAVDGMRNDKWINALSLAFLKYFSKR